MVLSSFLICNMIQFVFIQQEGPGRSCDACLLCLEWLYGTKLPLYISTANTWRQPDKTSKYSCCISGFIQIFQSLWHTQTHISSIWKGPMLLAVSPGCLWLIPGSWMPMCSLMYQA